MMNVIELETKAGQKFLYDFDSGWEIYDNGKNPAVWTNFREARNLDAAQTYQQIKDAVKGQTFSIKESP